MFLHPTMHLSIYLYMYLYLHCINICRHGGWIVDGFPVIRDQWSTMIDNQLLPDSVISLDEEGAPSDMLLRRFTQQHGLPDPGTYKAPAQGEAPPSAAPVEGSQQPNSLAGDEKVPDLLYNHMECSVFMHSQTSHPPPSPSPSPPHTL